jgi:hypothetical protein
LTTSASAPILPSLGSFVRLPNKGGGLSWRNRQSRAPSTFVRPDTPYCLVQSNADGSTHRGGDLRQSAMRSEMTASDQLRPTGSSIRGSPRGLAVQRQALCSHGPRRSGEAARLIHETPAEFGVRVASDQKPGISRPLCWTATLRRTLRARRNRSTDGTSCPRAIIGFAARPDSDRALPSRSPASGRCP